MTQERFSSLQWLTGAALLAWLLYLLSPILTPFVAAAILAYLCAPLVDWLCARRVPRAGAALLVMLLLSGLLVLLALLLLPMLQREIVLFMSRLPALFDALRVKFAPFMQQHLHVNFQLDGEALRTWLNSQWQQGAGGVTDRVLPWLGGGSAALLGLLMNAVLMPVVLFYLLRDWALLLGRIEELIPRRWHGTALQIVAEVDAVLDEFLRGQIIVMLVMR